MKKFSKFFPVTRELGLDYFANVFVGGGLSQAQIDRLRAPIGLAIPARSPWEVAVSVIAEVIAARDD